MDRTELLTLKIKYEGVQNSFCIDLDLHEYMCLLFIVEHKDVKELCLKIVS